MEEDFQSIREKLESKLINKLLDSVLNGEDPTFKSDPEPFLFCYDIVSHYGNKNPYTEKLFNYHNEVIEKGTNSAYEKIKDLSGLELADSFVLFTERINYLILKMLHIFSYIEFYYLKSVRKKYDKLVKFSLDIYKKCFYDKLKEKLDEILNGNVVDEAKKEKIKASIKHLEFAEPIIQINKEDKTIIWLEKENGKK